MGVTYRRGNIAAISRRSEVDVDDDGHWQAINDQDDDADDDANDDE